MSCSNFQYSCRSFTVTPWNSTDRQPRRLNFTWSHQTSFPTSYQRYWAHFETFQKMFIFYSFCSFQVLGSLQTFKFLPGTHLLTKQTSSNHKQATHNRESTCSNLFSCHNFRAKMFSCHVPIFNIHVVALL